MEGTGIKEIVIEKIYSIARKNNIKKAILFGSRARGDYKRASDIDLLNSRLGTGFILQNNYLF